MMTNPKRHYRAVQRDKDATQDTLLLQKENIREFAILGIIMYATSLIISGFMGYFIGKNN